ncbi:ATP-grasp domain-containing protein [Pseudomonas sp. N40(2020)]|uniref:ATP-grasp domain-containing protein n=1 Tax=Pseudomonas sp. N40(2020) TaxID=2767798 RepID=UPI0016576148|nr:ATP-grasp domain-containing protein [Pseudomonas sp. N40(2020)]MBC8999842.1 ATP-grasp domain-containing protein [Pseudomonas sp. N40(2020)]
MKILILHRVPYPRIEYHRGIDHDLHDVTYLGKQAAIDTLPAELRCHRVTRPGVGSAYDEAQQWLAQFPQHFDRIISMSEYELLDAAHLREVLNVEGASVAAVNLARNKLDMKAAVEARQLRVPRFMALKRYLALQGHVPWHGATVLKPHSGASSMDVSIHQQPVRAFDEITRKISELSLCIDEFQVEEFISGPIRHFDGLVQNGRILTMLSSQYVGTCLDYMERGHPLGSWHLETTAPMQAWVSAALEAVQIRNGAFHLEAIMEDDEPVFLEVGNRVGGADVVATYELATGIHLPSLELRIHVEGEVDIAPLTQQQPSLGFGWFVFPGHTHRERIYQGLDGADELRSNPFVVQWNELQPGALLPGHVTYSAFEAPLAGIIKTAEPQQTKAWMQTLFSRVRLAENLTSVA